ncbi:MAG: HAMP domain-containing sensor histidine kinase [Terracoccus sp.]
MRNWTVWAWVAVAVPCTALMWLLPGSETVPYHIAWAVFALCFGLQTWSRAATWASLGLFTVVTGAVLVDRVVTGVLDWQEAAETPLMLLLMALMVWHVRRRQRAVAQVTALAEGERREARARELLTRRTSHELRSPLTIAKGYTEVLSARLRHTDSAVELAIIDDELDRLTRVCERLVRSMRAQQDQELEDVDLDDLLSRTGLAWAAVADRSWIVTARAGTLHCSPERVRASLDTLVENALRYTCEGDTIELYGILGLDGSLAIGVADSGPGFTPQVLAARAHTGGGPPGAGIDSKASLTFEMVGDALSQTGLGLGMVEDVATRRGGRLEIGVSRWGGAQVGMRWGSVPASLMPLRQRESQTMIALPVTAGPPVSHDVTS